MTRETPQIKPSDSHRRAVRHLLRHCRSGSLATTLPDGGPYVSLVTQGTLHDGSPLFLLSTLAEHTRNLLRDPRAAFMVEEASALPNPQTGPRATLTGVLHRADGAEAEALTARFLARHPAAALYAGFADFALWRMRVERVHFVGGFARAVWIDDGLGLPAALCAALEELEPSAIDHMNNDHADALAAIAAAHGGSGGSRDGGWTLTALDADGIDLTRADEAIRAAFANPLAGANELQPSLVALARDSRLKLRKMADSVSNPSG